MVEVSVKVSGGQLQVKKAATLGELKKLVDAPKYQATINGEVENNDAMALTEGDFVTLTAPVKGA